MLSTCCTCRVVSLKDPNTFARMQQPVRFTDTCSNDLRAFELESFLDVAQRTLKWIDPHSMKASCVQNLQVCVCVCMFGGGARRGGETEEGWSATRHLNPNRCAQRHCARLRCA